MLDFKMADRTTPPPHPPQKNKKKTKKTKKKKKINKQKQLAVKCTTAKPHIGSF